MPNELIKQYEPPHNKTNKMNMRPTNTQISLGIRPVWSESSLSQSAWRRFGSLAIHWVHCKDSDQTGRMPRLIRVFAGRKVILLVLSWGSSYNASFYGVVVHAFLVCFSFRSLKNNKSEGEQDANIVFFFFFFLSLWDHIGYIGSSIEIGAQHGVWRFAITI